MAESITSAAACALEELAAYLVGPRLASPSSSTPCSRAGNVRQGVERLSRMLVRIRATLDDAEEMEIGDGSARLWLRELAGVAGDAEDVLDEVPREVSRLRAMESDGPPPRGRMEEATDAMLQRIWKAVRQVSGSISATRSHGLLAFLDDVEQRMEAINSRFDEIMKDRVALQFEESHGRRHVGTPVRRPSSSLVEKSCIFGREKDLEAIKRFLLDAEPSGTSNTSVTAIVGMGGLGKTTLAQFAYNDDSVRKHFDMKLWVYVSEDFDLVRLTRAMIETSTQKPCHLTELDPLHIRLKEELGGKRFLLVLDDVWEDKNLSSNWDTLTAPLLYGCKGSKIIITTRHEKVAKMTRATSTYHLSFLQEDHCLELFRRWAFEGRDPDALPNLMAIGEKISKKCKGLPLAAKTLAGLLRSEDDEEVWNSILQCDIWNIDFDEETGIMAILQLSYQHLPAHLKRCFRYCSVFPKGHEFDKDHLVRMWVAQGYVQVRGKGQMEDTGKAYFDDLLRRSFFQYSQEPKTFLMHVLIHDLAMIVSRDECCSVEGDKSCGIPRDVQHISVVRYSDTSSTPSLSHIYGTGTVRSLLFTRCSFKGMYMMKLLDDLFNQMKHLRLLDLSCTDLENLPTSIGFLKHLRYLGLRSNHIKQLPESVGSLYHLQTLDLESSGIEFLPKNLSNLFNLRHIICKNDFEYPVGIGKLINLQTMTGFHVSSSYGCAKLGELKDINNIISLRISGIANLTNVDEVEKACLEKKEQLRALDLSWGYCSPITDKVLESLKPNPKLEWLSIACFDGQSPPSWLGHPSFSKLATVKLFGSVCWTSLPPLGQLPSLKCLYISTVKQVEYIGDEFFSGGFPQLETLTFKYMTNWKSWRGAQKGECCQLRKLTIDFCERLVSFSMNNLDALQDLEIIGCDELQFSGDEQVPSTLQVLSINRCPFLTKWCQYHRQRLMHIRWLDIEGIDKNVLLRDVCSVQEATDACLRGLRRLLTLELVWDYQAGHRSFKQEELEEVLENLQPHNNLNNLVIQGYIGSRFATWLGDPSFTRLVYVKLIHCSQCEVLPPLGLLPVLTQLYVRGAHKLRCIGKEFFNNNCSISGRKAFPSLRKLEFNDMPSWEEWVEMQDGYLPCLCELILKHCPVLKALPRLPTSLREIQVDNCDVITFPHSLDHITSLSNLRISQVSVLKKLPCLPLGLRKLVLEGLPELADLVPPPSLRDLVLRSCSEAMVAASFPRLTLLTSLQISDFPKLTTIPLHNLGILQELHVSNCPLLITLDCINFSSALLEYTEGLQALRSLECLSISDCSRLHFSASERPPSTLKSMVIINCPLARPWHHRHWRNCTEANR